MENLSIDDHLPIIFEENPCQKNTICSIRGKLIITQETCLTREAIAYSKFDIIRETKSRIKAGIINYLFGYILSSLTLPIKTLERIRSYYNIDPRHQDDIQEAISLLQGIQDFINGLSKEPEKHLSKN